MCIMIRGHLHVNFAIMLQVCDGNDDENFLFLASQMTLRRHILRNHTPRSMWGYQCPHCTEKFMEPASYQHHVL